MDQRMIASSRAINVMAGIFVKRPRVLPESYCLVYGHSFTYKTHRNEEFWNTSVNGSVFRDHVL